MSEETQSHDWIFRLRRPGLWAQRPIIDPISRQVSLCLTYL